MPAVALAKAGWVSAGSERAVSFGWQANHKVRREPRSMKYVYVIQSVSTPSQYYTGITTDPTSRLSYHNAGKVPHTSKFTPWELVVFVAFRNEDRAIEKYLKSGSGRAFATRHFR